MSYRSVKRVLGETHLEWKCLVLFGLCALVLTGASFWFYGHRVEKLAYSQTRDTGRERVRRVLMWMHWKKLGESTPANKTVVDAFVDEIEGGKYSWEGLRPNRLTTSGKPLTEDDRTVLEKLLAQNAPKHGVDWDELQRPDGYYYYQVVRASGNACARCHRGKDRPPDAREGSILGVVRVGFPGNPIKSAVLWNRAFLVAMAIGTAFLLVLASYVIIRYVIAKPVKHLQDVSEAIARGEMDKRAEINTRDEFEALGTAFNRMVRHLVDLQQKAQQAKTDLDRKVDELAQRNMQLYEMNRLKGDFLATVSHELRTPLNSIIGFSDVLTSVNSLEEKYRRYVQNIQTSGKMLLEMINDILDLAKIESGKMEIRPDDFPIEHVVGAQCDMARPLTEKKNIDLEVDVHPGMPELHQDRSKVQQILNNLLSNAIKFTPDGGRIVVRAEPSASGENFYLVVNDTGVGIAEAEQTKVFEKFRQGETVSGGDAMTREYSGTGLGLSIVKELCKLLGGEISLESELGKGSTFTVRLPVRLPQRPPGESAIPDGFPGLPTDGLAANPWSTPTQADGPS